MLREKAINAPAHRHDTIAQLEYIWECLHAWREVMAESDNHDEVSDEVWDEVCSNMAYITEDLGFDMVDGEIVENGNRE